MRWKSPTIPERWEPFICWPLVVITSPAWITLAAVIGSFWLKRKIMGPREQWAVWFAWHPVEIDWGEWRWLELVERQSYGMNQDTHYRERRP